MERSLKDNKPRLRTDGVTHNHRPIRTTKTVIVRRQDTKNREGGGSLVTERFNRFRIADEKEEIYGVLFSRGGTIVIKLDQLLFHRFARFPDGQHN